MTFRAFKEGYRWADTDVLAYKADGSAPFKAVTRQVLFADPNMAAELRYFEVAQGGHSTLERHQHVHAVMVLRGNGRCLIGEKVWALKPHDLVSIPPMTWHQFRAAPDQSLGFLCMVNTERDRPQLPTESDLERLRAIPDVAAFIRTT
jgi:quercetin dioxygenase-like cupin family protein